MSLQSSLESFRDIDFNDLDFENIGSWPTAVKVIAWAICFALVLGVGYVYIISDMKTQLAGYEKKEQELKKTYAKRAYEAANLEAYKAQMVEIEENFGVLLGQLPKDAEVPGLLEDITRVGIKNGLAFNKIELQPEVPVEFYILQPIKIEVTGSYHDFGTFVGSVASLPRIVKLKDFTITPLNDSGALLMSIMAETYRYKE
ncbi:type IV pilus assembly protein PilO [Sinobacterium caligoides]|uniref:Type IV pilus assembly protein PilO n=1 Tax=Sinobacterium caligoides TaxID=933926 RepID=A0A3N2DRM5_9GAMM|nr:type 4a pilus biogenesis protein PilO [Sinobacterium caligoides]ROS01955.1 type IV pilus assembly protein PilO [Sinobacterium caligoides]